jgi:hypothetical protein
MLKYINSVESVTIRTVETKWSAVLNVGKTTTGISCLIKSHKSLTANINTSKANLNSSKRAQSKG